MLSSSVIQKLERLRLQLRCLKQDISSYTSAMIMDILFYSRQNLLHTQTKLTSFCCQIHESFRWRLLLVLSYLLAVKSLSATDMGKLIAATVRKKVSHSRNISLIRYL